MLQVYQSKKRQGKVKLFKDLKHYKLNLRQSLLQKDEIEDLQKVFKSKKDQYKIPKQKISLKREIHDDFDAYQAISMTFQQKISTYKQKQINQKMKQKINYLIDDRKKSVKSRPSIVYNLLNTFVSELQSQEPFKFNGQLKKSEQNLEHIKINSRKKVQEDKVDQVVPKKRSRFISLQTSMPEKAKQHYPSFEEVIQSKYAHKETKSYDLDVEELEKKMNKIQHKKKKYEEHQQKQDKLAYQKSTSSVKGNKRKSKDEENAQKTFTRSEHYSKMVIGTMSKFYQSKNTKHKQYDNMIQYLRHDRPLTAQIRRRNYQIIGKEQVGSVNLYRNNSEQYRRAMQKNNYNFYIALLKEVQTETEDHIPNTVKVLEQLKNILQAQYLLTKKQVKNILNRARDRTPDQLTDLVINRIEQYVQNKPQK